MIPSPDQFSEVGAYELLEAAAQGYIASDRRWLQALLDYPDAAGAIARFTAEPRDEDRVDLRENLLLIARYLKRPELIPFLIDVVRDHRDSLPDLLVEVISSYREAMIEPLIDLYRELGPEEGSEIPFLLATLGVRDPRIEDILNSFAGADSDEAAFCRETYKEVSSASPDTEPFPIWDHFPDEDDPPFDAFPPADRLVFLDADSPGVRAAAAASLVEEPELDSAVIDRLREAAASDPDPSVRGSCWHALLRALDSDSRLLEEMKHRFFSPETPAGELGGLALALASTDASSEIKPRLVELYNNNELRPAVVEAMAQTFDRTFEPYVVRALDDPDVEVKRSAVLGIGLLRLVGHLGRVKGLFDDPDLRDVAVAAYASAFPSDETPARMRSLFRKIEELAEGLTPEEAELVEIALDNRLAMAGKGPTFLAE